MYTGAKQTKYMLAKRIPSSLNVNFSNYPTASEFASQILPYSLLLPEY